MTQVNPYRKNCEILQSFFAKPLTLIMAIAMCISFIFNFAYSVSCVSLLSIPLLTIPAVIGFFILFFASKNLNGKPLTTPIRILKVYSIAEIVIASLIFIASIIATISSLFFSPLVNISSSVILYLFSVVIPTVLIDLMLYIFMFRMLCSFKNSTSSVFLYKKGAVAFGVTSLIALLNTITSTFIKIFLINHIAQDGMFIIVKAFISNTVLFLTITIMTALINCIVYLLMAVYSFSYNSFIKDVCNRIIINKPIERYSKPEEIQKKTFNANVNTNSNTNNNFDSSTVDMWESIYKTNTPVSAPVVKQPPTPAPVQQPVQPQVQPILPQQPILFTPQPVHFNAEPAFSPQKSNEAPVEQDNNPYKPIPPYQNTPIQNPYINDNYH